MTDTRRSGRTGMLQLVQGRSALGTQRQSAHAGTIRLAWACRVALAHAGARAPFHVGARGVQSVGRA
jgi:hypothetical protein